MQSYNQSSKEQKHSIDSFEWKNNWAGTWSLLECCSYGYEYTSLLEEVWGVGLEIAIFEFNKGKSINFLPAQTIQTFSEHLAKDLNNEDNLKKYLDTLRSIIEDTLSFLKHTSIDSYEDYIKLWRIQDTLLTYNFPTKRLPEYLDNQLAEKFLPIFGELRILGEPIYEISQQYIQDFLSTFSAQTGLPSHILSSMTLLELEQFFKQNVLPDITELTQRYEHSVLIVSGNTYTVHIGKEADSIIQSITHIEDSHSIKGTVAYTGIVRGTVKITHTPEHPGDLPDTMVLVTSMTRPNYLPLFKQAVAVVTDAGGILSHAAITARELKKPCIIGTEIATKVLKNGDTVEVDAEQGIVTIIS